MTFCIAVRVSEGVVALADTQIVRGAHVSTKFKLSELQVGGRSAMIMTSGLRSVRDKVMARLTDGIAEWNRQLEKAVSSLPTEWADELFTPPPSAVDQADPSRLEPTPE